LQGTIAKSRRSKSLRTATSSPRPFAA
jgi:hypothetical protein